MIMLRRPVHRETREVFCRHLCHALGGDLPNRFLLGTRGRSKRSASLAHHCHGAGPVLQAHVPATRPTLPQSEQGSACLSPGRARQAGPHGWLAYAAGAPGPPRGTHDGVSPVPRCCLTSCVSCRRRTSSTPEGCGWEKSTWLPGTKLY